MLPHSHRCWQKNKIPGSETNMLLLYSTPHRGQCISFPWPPNFMELKQNWALVDAVHSGLMSQLKKPPLRKSQSLKNGFQQTYLHSLQERDVVSFKLVCKQISLQLRWGSVSIFQGCLLYKHSWNSDQDQSRYMYEDTKGIVSPTDV